MIPKFSNPFSLLESTTHVSRAALNGDSEDEEDMDYADPEHDQLVARLENILKRSIEATPLEGSDGQPLERPRKKRRKEKYNESQRAGESVEEAVPFRLLSGKSQPKDIILAPKPLPVFVSQGPALEDTETEAALRASRAREIAVDHEWVLAETRKPSVATPSAKSKRKVLQVTAKLPEGDPTLLVFERTKHPSPKPPYIAQANPTIEIHTTPYEQSADCCPTVEVQSPTISEVSMKQKRRRGKSRNKPPAQPTFWRPTAGMGGKALGYAWGYPGSRPLLSPQADETPRYERDTMKKAEHA